MSTRVLKIALTVTAAAGLGAGGFFGYRWLRTSPRFAIHEIVLSGHNHVTREQVMRVTGLDHPERPVNIFSVSLGAIERSIEEKLPWVAHASASRRMPDKIVVAVTERQASAVVLTGEGLYLADKEGHPFKRAAIESGEGDGLTVVSGIDRRLFTDDPDTAAALVRRALGIAALWRAVPDRPPVGEVHLDRDGVTLFTLENAVAIALGRAVGASPAETDAALYTGMARFDAVWSALTPEERASARTIHLDSRTRPDRVTVAVASGQTR